MASHNFLLCDEEFPSPLPSPPTPSKEMSSPVLLFSDATTDEECEYNIFKYYMQREHVYAPQSGYLEHLRLSDLSGARFRAVRWILVACNRLNLAYGTAFAAVNYIDRFISMNRCIKWQLWMIELLCIACLSIASKIDQVSIPSLHDFQMEDLDHMFQPSTIQRMELAVLKALDFRLTSVTPYSYVELLIWRLTVGSIHVALTTRTTELLLRTLLETKFLEYTASAIALSALRCGLQELTPLKSDDHLSVIERLMPVESKEEVDRCHRIMEERAADPLCCPSSPVTVIPMQRTQVLDSYVDIDTLFFVKDRSQEDLIDHPKKKQKMEAL